MADERRVQGFRPGIPRSVWLVVGPAGVCAVALSTLIAVTGGSLTTVAGTLLAFVVDRERAPRPARTTGASVACQGQRRPARQRPGRTLRVGGHC